MNFGAMLSGVSGGFQDQEKVNIGKESNRIKEDEIAMQAENERMSQLRALGEQGLGTITATVDAALEQGIVDPEKLAQANAGVISTLQRLDAASGTNYAEQAKARIQGLSSVDASSAASLNDKYGKPPSGYRWTANGDLEVIANGPATKMPKEAAGALAGFDNLDMVDMDKVLGDWSWADHGKAMIDYETGKDIFGFGAMFRQIDATKDAVLRAMTGAAAPINEQRQYTQLYGITPYMTQRDRQTSMKMLQSYRDTFTRIVKEGRTPEEAHKVANKAVQETIPTGSVETYLEERDKRTKENAPKAKKDMERAFIQQNAQAALDAMAGGKKFEDIQKAFAERGITINSQQDLTDALKEE